MIIGDTPAIVNLAAARLGGVYPALSVPFQERRIIWAAGSPADAASLFKSFLRLLYAAAPTMT